MVQIPVVDYNLRKSAELLSDKSLSASIGEGFLILRSIVEDRKEYPRFHCVARIWENHILELHALLRIYALEFYTRKGYPHNSQYLVEDMLWVDYIKYKKKAEQLLLTFPSDFVDKHRSRLARKYSEAYPKEWKTSSDKYYGKTKTGEWALYPLQ